MHAWLWIPQLSATVISLPVPLPTTAHHAYSDLPEVDLWRELQFQGVFSDGEVKSRSQDFC